MRKLLIIVLAFLSGFMCLSAAVDSKGTDFWLSFMPNFHNRVENSNPALKYGDSLYIFINAEEPTSGKITYRDRYGIETVENFKIDNPDEIYTFKVSFYDYEIWGYNYHGISWSNFQTEKPAPQHFHIETEKEVTVYAHSQAVTTSDAFLVLPLDAIGFTYYLMAYASDGRTNNNEYARTPSQFLIVATEDNTTITINTTVDTYLHPAGERTVTLNKGYSYLVQAKFDAGQNFPDLTGTRITANKRIAVFGGHQRANIPAEDTKGTSRDCLFEQIPPVSTWGKNAFIIPPAEPRDTSARKGSLYRVLAAEDKTEIKVDGVIVKTLNKGEFYENVLEKPLILEAAKPILVGIFKYTSGMLGTRAIGDPFMMLIPPKEQFIEKCKIVNVQAWEINLNDGKYYPVYTEQYITIVAPESALDSVYVDNVRVSVGDFNRIGNSDYYYAHIEVVSGIHDVVAKEKIGVYIYGYGAANSYGYTGGMGFKVINYDPPRFATVDSCYKTYGFVRTSDTVQRHLLEVKAIADSSYNVDVRVSHLPKAPTAHFTVELIDYRLDGMAIVSATDDLDKTAFRRVEIPGLTLAVPGHKGIDTLPVFVINARPTATIKIPVENHGKFNKKIISADLSVGVEGRVVNFPGSMLPAATDSIELEFTMTDKNPKRDTLYLTTKCGTVAIAAIYVLTSDCDPSAFDFPEFIDKEKIRMNGKANLSQNFVRLTRSEIYQSGSLWYYETVPVLDGFSTEFSFRMTEGKNYDCDDGSAQGADGIAFVIQNAGNAAVGYVGGGIGYEGIYNSLAIEFDTYSNDANQIENYLDPNGNHIAVQTLGTAENTAKHITQAKLAMNENVMPMLADGTLYYAKIEFSLKNKLLLVYLDTVENPEKEVLRIENFEIGRYLSLDRGYRAYVGFTAATGCAVENHDIISWSFCPEFPNPETAIENDEFDVPNDIMLDLSPNPFNSSCSIIFNNQSNSFVKLTVLDLMGNTVATLHNGQLAKGRHYFRWRPEGLDRGIYFVRLNIGTKQIIGKIVFTY